MGEDMVQVEEEDSDDIVEVGRSRSHPQGRITRRNHGIEFEGPHADFERSLADTSSTTKTLLLQRHVLSLARQK